MKFEHLIVVGYFILVLSISSFYLFWKRKKMGQVVYHLPQSRFHQLLFLFMSVGYVAIPVIEIILSRILSDSNTPSPTGLLICLTCAAVSASSANRRFEIRENGITVYGNFTRFKKLTGFQWKAEGDYKLGLGEEAYILGVHKPGDRFPWWLEQHKFQPVQQENAKKLLSQYLPEVV